MLPSFARFRSDALLSWWFAALRASAPRVLLNGIEQRRCGLILHVEDGSLHLLQRNRNRESTVGVFPISALSETEPKGDFRGGAIVRLSKDLAYTRQVTLPLAAEPDLHDIVRNEIDRQTPFRPEQAYFDFVVVERTPDSQTITVEIIVAKRAAVDNVVAFAARNGWGLKRATVEGAHSDRINLFRFIPRATTSAVHSRIALALAVCAAFLGGVALERSYTRLQASATTLDSAVSELRKKAREAKDLEAELQRQQLQLTFLEKKRKDVPSPLDVLSVLTSSLPDDTWLTEAQITKREIRISGYSGDASAALAALNRSPRLSNARFTSPVTRDSERERDRFNATVDIKGGDIQ
jgi:general secretion pathway protein L